MAKSSTGLDENIAGLLCYLFGWLSGLVFFLIEKDSEFVRFHAAQSLVVFGSFTVLGIVLPVIPIFGLLLLPLLSALCFVLWLLLMIMAFQGNRFELPLVQDLVKKMLAS